MSDQSTLLSLPYIMPAQAQKHLTHNEALRTLDTLVQLSVASATEVAARLDDRIRATMGGFAERWIRRPQLPLSASSG